MNNCLMGLTLFGVFAFVAPQSASAATRNEIRDLLRQVDRELGYSYASQSDLDQVRDNLLDSIQVLRNSQGGGGTPSQECLDWAYQNYNQSLNSSAAMTKATEACRSVGDLEVAKFLYSKHSQSLNSAAAMDLAIPQARRELSSRLDVVEYAYGKYNQALNSSAAATRAAEQSLTARRDALSCLSFAYDRHNQSLNSAAAMDAAFSDCR